MASEQGKGLSPLMKFDLYIYKNVERFFPKGVPSTAFSHASRRELEIHYIGDNTHHRYWNSRGFAGKCLGWALSTFDFNEPTRDRVIDGILFRPADIKGILAALYNAAQFFIPENAVIGKEFHDASNSSKAAHEDVTPPDFIRSLRRTIQRGSLMEADLDPGDGVWNYPIYRYELDYTVGGKVSTPTASVRAKIYYADDEVEIDDVFSTKENRTDLKDRELTFELTLPKDWGGDISRATSGTWTGESVDKHPDVIIEGIEKGWRKTIYEYANTNMKEEVNFQLLKRVKIKGNEWTPIVDELLKRYYAK